VLVVRLILGVIVSGVLGLGFGLSRVRGVGGERLGRSMGKDVKGDPYDGLPRRRFFIEAPAERRIGAALTNGVKWIPTAVIVLPGGGGSPGRAAIGDALAGDVTEFPAVGAPVTEFPASVTEFPAGDVTEKRRGPKASGAALSAADRKRAERARKRGEKSE
jgi:hypothetical protein